MSDTSYFKLLTEDQMATSIGVNASDISSDLSCYHFDTSLNQKENGMSENEEDLLLERLFGEDILQTGNELETWGNCGELHKSRDTTVSRVDYIDASADMDEPICLLRNFSSQGNSDSPSQTLTPQYCDPKVTFSSTLENPSIPSGTSIFGPESLSYHQEFTTQRFEDFSHSLVSDPSIFNSNQSPPLRPCEVFNFQENGVKSLEFTDHLQSFEIPRQDNSFSRKRSSEFLDSTSRDSYVADSVLSVQEPCNYEFCQSKMQRIDYYPSERNTYSPSFTLNESAHCTADLPFTRINTDIAEGARPPNASTTDVSNTFIPIGQENVSNKPYSSELNLQDFLL